MSRKTMALAIGTAVVLMSLAARPAAAQSRLDTRPVRLAIDLGYVNLFSYPKWLHLGPELELRLGPVVSFIPEAALWVRQSGGGSVRFVPGATLNLRFRRFMIGGGAVGRVSDWRTMAGGYLVPKVHVGYITGPARLTFSLLYLSTSQDVVAGLSVGMAIGRPGRGPED